MLVEYYYSIMTCAQHLQQGGGLQAILIPQTEGAPFGKVHEEDKTQVSAELIHYRERMEHRN
jgi:hypothetical protein